MKQNETFARNFVDQDTQTVAPYYNKEDFIFGVNLFCQKFDTVLQSILKNNRTLRKDFRHYKEKFHFLCLKKELIDNRKKNLHSNFSKKIEKYDLFHNKVEQLFGKFYYPFYEAFKNNKSVSHLFSEEDARDFGEYISELMKKCPPIFNIISSKNRLDIENYYKLCNLNLPLDLNEFSELLTIFINLEKKFNLHDIFNSNILTPLRNKLHDFYIQSDKLNEEFLNLKDKIHNIKQCEVGELISLEAASNKFCFTSNFEEKFNIADSIERKVSKSNSKGNIIQIKKLFDDSKKIGMQRLN